MAAYVIVEVETHDLALMTQYRELAGPIVKAYDGRFLARGGHCELWEGDGVPERIVVLEFPSIERAKEWWACDEYRGPKEMRQRAGHTRMTVVEGLAQQ